MKLNEHGPALNAFWIPKHRDWARQWSGLTTERGGPKRKVPKENRAGGSEAIGLLLSVRKISSRRRSTHER